MTRILITGGFGFIGGRLGQHLHKAGHQIVLGSRKANRSPDWLPQAEVFQTKWNDRHFLEQICNGIDVVVQTAGMNAQDCATNPEAALEFNGLATARLLEGAITANVRRFIYLSTAHVYASPLVGTITEDTCPRNLHPYATSHLAGENTVLGSNQRGDIEGIVIRLANVFGAPVHKDVNCWTSLVNDLCRQSVQTRNMVLRSSGSQQRDFIAMAEVCSVIKYLSSPDSVSLLPSIINVGSGVSLSVFEMAQLIQQRCNQVLGFTPELHLPEIGIEEKNEILEYRQDGLTKMGLMLSINNSVEIDSLLQFCHESFNSHQREFA